MPACILVVEDDFLIRLTLVEALADDGFAVVEAGTAEEALRLLKGLEVSLVLTDIQLPGGMDGREMARHIRAERPGLPIIYTTGRPDEGLTPSDRDLIITKPYLPSEICAAARLLAG
jgi:CheY-like chemotaxis protein